MSQIFDKDGNVIPVTVLQAGPCPILALLEEPRKVQVGFEPVKEQRVNKPQLGFFKKVGVPPLRLMREFSSTDNSAYQVGQEICVDLFKPGDFVDVTGISRGKGFQGGMVRWNWAGGPGGHGSMHHRRVGSIGASADPSRTFRGTHMPGHMGNEQVTVQNLRVMRVELDKNLILIKGAVPGHRNALLTISIAKKKKYRSLEEKRATAAKQRNPMKQSKSKAKGKK